MKFYRIEDGKVKGWQYGTEDPNDPTSTSAVLAAWASEAPGRSVIKTEDHDTEKSKFLKVVDGLIERMTPGEKQAVLDAEKAERDAAKALEDSALEKVAQAAGLSKEEKEAYKKARGKS